MSAVTRALSAGLVVAVAIALGGCGGREARSEGAPLGAVLEAGRSPALIVIDLDSGKTVERVPLRSLALDIAADAQERLFITAQCGGVSNDADNALGVIDAGDGFSLDYVELDYPNPGSLISVGSGKAFHMNGWMDQQGLVVGIVDAPRRTVLRDGRVAGLTGGVSNAGGSLWAPAVSQEGTESLVRIDAETLESTVVASGARMPAFIAGELALGGAMVAATVESGTVPGVTVGMRRFDGTAASLAERPLLVDLADGPGRRTAVVGGTLAFVDFTDVNPDEHGEAVLLVPLTLDSTPVRVPFPGGPAAICALGESFVVLEAYTGRLIRLDPRTGAKKVIATLKGPKGRFVDLAVLP